MQLSGSVWPLAHAANRKCLTLKNQDLIKDILLILTDVHFTDFLVFVDKMTEKHEKDPKLEQLCS